MTPTTIPPAALEAGARALYAVRCKITAVASGARLSDFEPWSGVAAQDQDDYRYEARAAFLAMMKAWPDMAYRVMPYAALILPLPTQENGDD